MKSLFATAFTNVLESIQVPLAQSVRPALHRCRQFSSRFLFVRGKVVGIDHYRSL